MNRDDNADTVADAREGASEKPGLSGGESQQSEHGHENDTEGDLAQGAADNLRTAGLPEETR